MESFGVTPRLLKLFTEPFQDNVCVSTLTALLAKYADAAPHPRGFVRTLTETTTRDRLFALLQANTSAGHLATLFAEGVALTSDAATRVAPDDRGGRPTNAVV